MENTKFLENSAEKNGGAICAESFSNITVSRSCVFYMNEALEGLGDAIYTK